ncbi:Ail/Lom family outer membrane beta-barrel protein, partial [Escherichia coli]|nr:Ail/Lom family outer membrane beta-barrel protein [Escherichia coli]
MHDSNTSLAWGAGVQFNPTESVAAIKKRRRLLNAVSWKTPIRML